MSKNIPVYELDDETKDILIDAFNWLVRYADCQIDEESRLEIQSATEDLAYRFGLPLQRVEITVDDDGEWHLSIDGASEELAEKQKPSLSIIPGGKDSESNDDTK